MTIDSVRTSPLSNCNVGTWCFEKLHKKPNTEFSSQKNSFDYDFAGTKMTFIFDEV